MVIFHTYVKLPEGSFLPFHQIQFHPIAVVSAAAVRHAPAAGHLIPAVAWEVWRPVDANPILRVWDDIGNSGWIGSLKYVPKFSGYTNYNRSHTTWFANSLSLQIWGHINISRSTSWCQKHMEKDMKWQPKSMCGWHEICQISLELEIQLCQTTPSEIKLCGEFAGKPDV